MVYMAIRLSEDGTLRCDIISVIGLLTVGDLKKTHL